MVVHFKLLNRMDPFYMQINATLMSFTLIVSSAVCLFICNDVCLLHQVYILPYQVGLWILLISLFFGGVAHSFGRAGGV